MQNRHQGCFDLYLSTRTKELHSINKSLKLVNFVVHIVKLHFIYLNFHKHILFFEMHELTHFLIQRI